MTKILNFGSLNIDLVYQVDHIVQPGETISAAGLQTFAGGKGLNQSVALARGGGEVYHAGGIGADDGAILNNMLTESGVKTDYLQLRAGKSGHALIQVDRDGQNCIIIHAGTNHGNTETYINDVLENFGEGDWLVLQNEINLNRTIVDQAKARGLKIAYNPSPIDDAALDLDLNAIDLFFVNEIEGCALSGEPAVENQIKVLREKYPDAGFVITLGSHGSLYFDRDNEIHQDIFKVKAVDTTAAGDTFTGFFLTSVVRGEDYATALKIASKASSIAVSRPGAAPSIPTLNEVLAALKE